MARGIQLTLDEWFYHWFGDKTNYKTVAKLFITILEVCDKIVLQKGTPLAAKFYALCEESKNYPPFERSAAKIVARLFLQNLDKVYWVNEVEDLNEEISPHLPRKDLYLVQMCLQTQHKILITSDGTLFQNLFENKKVLNITPFMAEKFIAHYPDIDRLH